MVGVDDGPSTKPPTRTPEANFLYWLVSGACIVFGFLGILSIGFPFLVVGLAMTGLSPSNSTNNLVACNRRNRLVLRCVCPLDSLHLLGGW